MKYPLKKTKIVATVGPACNNKEMMLELIKVGVNVFRLNFSHGSHAEHLAVIKMIREINEEHNLNIGILQDLQGPKIRLGLLEGEPFEIVAGQKIQMSTEDLPSTPQKLTTIYKELPKDVRVGDAILIDDGKIELRVLATNGVIVQTEVIYGGMIKPKKGINLPDSPVSATCLTEKDTEDLMFGLENDLDWIALSFVRNAIDIEILRHTIKLKGKSSKIVAKIERPEAVKNIDEIIAASDAIMVARGDLGVEVGFEAVPTIQKMMIAKCNKAAKPVIVATQMMESMIDNPRPTRAETNDVANAVIDGADAVMLSAETATGKYPKLVVESMTKTIRMAEDEIPIIYKKNLRIDKNSKSFDNDSVIAAANFLVDDVGANAIIGMTSSGYTAFRLASHRPKANIFIFTSNRGIINQLNLLWGVRAFYYDKFVSTDQTFEDLQNFLIKNDYIEKGNKIIHLASMPIEKKLRTNVIKLSIV
jgi:pyruvate kinase